MDINAYCTAIFLTLCCILFIYFFFVWIIESVKKLFSRKSRIKNLENKVDEQNEENENSKHPIEEQTLVKATATTSVRYIVKFQREGKNEYSLPAHIRVISNLYFSPSPSNFHFEREDEGIYLLDKVYWNSSGGTDSFVKNPPRLFFNETITAKNDDNKTCFITLTHKLVPITQIEINELNIKKNFLERKENSTKKLIKKLCTDAATTLPEFTEALTEYEHTLNKQIADYLSSKKHPAITSSEKIKELSKKNKDLEKKFYTLQINYNILKRKFDKLNSKSKDSDTDETKK